MSAKQLLNGISQTVSFDADSEREWINAYFSDLGDMLCHEKVREMIKYNHHKTINCHFHSVAVSYITYKICKMLNCNYVDAARAALLHDFYLYDWHITKHDELHAWYHPKMAQINAEKYFGKLTPMQSDMILSHMWPLHIVPPKSKEGMVLTFADKICTNFDLLGLSERFMPVYEAVNAEVERKCRH